MKKKPLVYAAVMLAGASSPCGAWEFRCRFVERSGIDPPPIVDNMIDASDGAARRIRIQFGVFDDAQGAAPAGGFVGWNIGTIAVSGSAGNSQERRTPGRVAPFNFATGRNANGNPPPPTLAGPDAPDFDFQMLTEIDATLGTQVPFWGCFPDGTPRPQPPAVVRGINTFVSVYEITIDPAASGTTYTVAFSGNLIAASEWRPVNAIQPPDCGDPNNPDDDMPGVIVYAPFVVPPEEFACTLTVLVPGPEAGLVMGISMLAWGRARHVRRRAGAPSATARSGTYSSWA